MAPRLYWEARARRFSGERAGLAAVCSYGMPLFYNGYIHVTQWLALAPWLRVTPGTSVLDVGCGVGRWSRRLARAGARVTGVDLAPTMVAEAKLDLGIRFDRIIGVTVLQHILDSERFERAIDRLEAHLAPGGRIVLLEAAPSRHVARCNSRVFVAREAWVYEAAFARAGLQCVAVRGVDPSPFKVGFLPWYPHLPRFVALSGLALVTALSLPVDALWGRRLTGRSWHKLFVLARVGDVAARPA
jgi:SAM-dependent methyltransferase